MTETTLTIVTYNIQHGVRQKEIVRNIGRMARTGADIFCLQEVRKMEPFIGTAIERKLGPQWQSAYLLGDGFDLGFAFFWRSDRCSLEESNFVLAPKLKTMTLFERIKAGEKVPVQRGAFIGKFRIGEHAVRIANVHLDWAGGILHRTKQVRALLRHLHRVDLSPQMGEVVCGDFNMWALSTSVLALQNRLEKVFGTEYQNAFPDVSWTFDSKTIDPYGGFAWFQRGMIALGIRFRQKLDYFFFRNLKLVESEMKVIDGSDHYPLIATLSLE